MVKLWLNTINMPSSTNINRLLPGRPLHSKHQPSILIHRPHHPRRPIWLNNTKPTRHRSIHILHLHLHSHRTRTILRIIPKQRNLDIRHYPTHHTNGNRILRLCSPMRTDIILSRNRNYKPIDRSTLLRHITNNLIMRRIRNQ